MIDLKKNWKRLRQRSNSIPGMIREQVPYDGVLSCFIGFIPITQAFVFQLFINRDSSIESNWLQKFRGVEIQILPSGDGDYYTIMLLDNNLEDIFYAFIDDIIIEVSTVSNSTEALKLINQRVNHWKRLFAKATGELLSSTKQRGLFGELFILQLLLEKLPNKKIVLSSWKGAENANQDFAIGNNAIEVKTSKAGTPSVNISNEHQLDFTSWDYIFLCVVAVNESSGVQSTLYQQINNIRLLLEPDNELVRDFERRLELVGMNKDMLEEYNDISYSVRRYRFYHIREGFPVITRSTLDYDAIKNVKYQIDISQCKEFEENEETVLSIIL